MKSDYGKTPKQQGIGESKIFCDPNAPDLNEHLLTLHVAGTPVSEMKKKLGKGGEAWLQQLSYHHTDEGIAERNAGKSESAARVTASPFDKELDHKADDLEASIEPWECYDPMKELKDRHEQPGETTRFLSPRTIERSGLRGWKIKLDAKGNQVKLGNMLMGTMPIERAGKRKKFFAEKAANEIKREQEAQKEKQERVSSEAGVDTSLSNKLVSGRFAVGTGSKEGDRTYSGNPEAHIGLRQVRGDEQL